MINNQHMRASSPVFVPTGTRSPPGSAINEYVPRFNPETGQNTQTAAGQYILLLDRAVNAKQNEKLFSKPVERRNGQSSVSEPIEPIVPVDMIVEFLCGRWVGSAADLKQFVCKYLTMIGKLSQLHHELCSVLYCAHVYESVLDPYHAYDGHYLKRLTMYLDDMRKLQDSHELMYLSHMIKKVQQPWERLFITLQYQMNSANISQNPVNISQNLGKSE